jgi:glycosyltransferase involved in cell wall biosynthesis
MTRLPSVSIVLPAYNAEATIGATLTGLAAQAGLAAESEVIVVDNASTDRTADIVRDFGVTLVREEQRGPSAARNRGLAAASGDIICHLDADTVPSRRWAAELARPFADERVVLAGGRTISWPVTTPAQRYTARSGRYEPENNIRREHFPFIPSQNLAVRRQAALAAGGWAEDLLTAEDVDFCQRVLRATPGGRMHYAERAILQHTERASDDALRTQAWTYGQGAAEVYRRYPDELGWTAARSLHVARVVAARAGAFAALSAGRALGLARGEDVEFAFYHALWTWWWWRGFFSVTWGGERRARP